MWFAARVPATLKTFNLLIVCCCQTVENNDGVLSLLACVLFKPLPRPINSVLHCNFKHGIEIKNALKLRVSRLFHDLKQTRGEIKFNTNVRFQFNYFNVCTPVPKKTVGDLRQKGPQQKSLPTSTRGSQASLVKLCMLGSADCKIGWPACPQINPASTAIAHISSFHVDHKLPTTGGHVWATKSSCLVREKQGSAPTGHTAPSFARLRANTTYKWINVVYVAVWGRT